MGRHRFDAKNSPKTDKPRVCLRCNKEFASNGPHHRICFDCEGRAADLPPTAARIGRGGVHRTGRTPE